MVSACLVTIRELSIPFSTLSYLLTDLSNRIFSAPYLWPAQAYAPTPNANAVLPQNIASAIYQRQQDVLAELEGHKATYNGSEVDCSTCDVIVDKHGQEFRPRGRAWRHVKKPNEEVTVTTTSAVVLKSTEALTEGGSEVKRTLPRETGSAA
jgi:hypothetical protein